MRNHLFMIVLAIFLGVSSTGTTGCKKNEDQAQQEADKARKESDVKAGKAVTAASAAKEAEEQAVTAKRVAEEKAVTATVEDRATLQKAVDDADRKTTYLKEKVAKVTGTMKQNVDAALAEVDKRREAVRARLTTLDTETGQAWETAKLQAEADTAALDQAIHSLEATLAR